MELSRNKVILFVTGGIVLFFLVIMLVIMLFSTNRTGGGKTTNEDFVVWMVGDDSADASDLIDGFKKYSNTKTEVRIESFNDYQEYSYALSYAISSGNSPDVFVLNNNEKNPLFENQTLGVSPDLISPSAFRKEYKTFISEQLISQTETGTEFLLGLPVGYETLGVFYNRKFVKSTDLENMSSLKSAITRLKERYNDIIPIAIGNGTTLKDSGDIATQFILSDGGDRSIETLTRKSIQNGIAGYTYFGDIDLDNGYNNRLQEMKLAQQKDIDLFSKGETFMVAGYPRLVKEIYKKGFSSSFLLASPFPGNSKGTGTSLINYNYFVINKDTNKEELSSQFLSYLNSDDGISKFLEAYPYYLPSKVSFEENLDTQMIDKNFKIAIGDFYNEDNTYTSFNKGIKNIYDEKLSEILDNEQLNIDDYIRLQKNINCLTSKIINQEDFSRVCK